ncbi:MAG: N-acetyltransferase family protein [Anaerolineae bacterium]|nr:N-acetyltransferase family protein [Anaerolineae bacterium]
MNFSISPMQPADWESVCDIYLQGISGGNATFETGAPTWETWDHSHLKNCRFVARHKDESILGWAALSPVSSRCVYAGVAEVSVYVSTLAQRQGVGRALLSELIKASEENGIWTLQAGILAENQASIELHAGLGFRLVGKRERIGQLAGVWRDTVLMERRSPTIGI